MELFFKGGGCNLKSKLHVVWKHQKKEKKRKRWLKRRAEPCCSSLHFDTVFLHEVTLPAALSPSLYMAAKL